MYKDKSFCGTNASAARRAGRRMRLADGTRAVFSTTLARCLFDVTSLVSSRLVSFAFRLPFVLAHGPRTSYEESGPAWRGAARRGRSARAASFFAAGVIEPASSETTV